MMNETIFLGGRPIAAWVGAADLASENCVAKGGKVEIIDTPAGQSGICVFPDGTRCEEWALLRGQCAPGAPPPRRHISPLLMFPAGGAVIGGLIGYAVKRDVRGTAVGAAVGAAAPFALAVAITSGWRP